MRKYLFVFLASVTFFISSCALQNVKDGKKPGADKGLAGFVLKSNWRGNQNSILAPVDFVFRKEGMFPHKVTMKSARDVYVLELQAGHYQPQAIAIGYGSFSLENFGAFDVEPGKLIYIGDINVVFKSKDVSALRDGARIYVENNLAGFSEELKGKYPATYQNYIPEAKILTAQEW